MILLLSQWLLMFWFCLCLGYSLSTLLSSAQASPENAISPPFAVFLGFAALAPVLLILAFFMPISAVLFWSLFAISPLLFLWRRKIWQQSFLLWYSSWRQMGWFGWLWLVVGSLISLLIAFEPADYVDHGLYYLDYLAWLERYPAVPGLANLHHRLGFNSSWHLIAAFFHAPYALDLWGMGSFLLLVFFLWSAHAWPSRGQTYVAPISLWFRRILPLPAHFFLFQLHVPSADGPIVIYLLLCFYLSIRLWERKGMTGDDRQWYVLAVLGAFLISIKLVAALGVILPALLFFVLKKPWALLRPLLALALIWVLPWVLRSYVLSGYWFFPLVQTAWGHPDWQVPAVFLQEDMLFIKGFARLRLANYWQVAQMSWSEWVPQWFGGLTSMRKFVLVLDLIFLLTFFFVLLWSFFRHSKMQRLLLQWWPLWLASYLAILAWWFVSPDFRFGLGFIAPVYLFLTASLCAVLARRPKFCLWPMVLGLLLAFLALSNGKYLWYNVLQDVDTASFWWRTPPAPQVELQGKNLQGKPIFVTTKENPIQCWNSSFPCTPYLSPSLQMRGEDFSEGFRQIPPYDVPAYRRGLMGKLELPDDFDRNSLGDSLD